MCKKCQYLSGEKLEQALYNMSDRAILLLASRIERGADLYTEVLDYLSRGENQWAYGGE